ncbi:MAG: hypothetical protein ABI222_07855 [Opitutaceae bacterium]
MTGDSNNLLSELTIWIRKEPKVKAAILFGSSAGKVGLNDFADQWSDIDLHVITTSPKAIEEIDWSQVIHSETFCLKIIRPATAGMRKVTVLFDCGQIDMVLVPASRLNLARLASLLGLHKRIPSLRIALNEIHTCIRSGYIFLKGERKWGAFYSLAMNKMPGVRLSDTEILNLAEVFLCDLLWIMQKLERGEIAAAQHILHKTLAETNFRLLRELRLRRDQPLLSFGIARRVETFLSYPQLSWVQVSARLDCEEIRRASWFALEGLKGLINELIPEWTIPNKVIRLISKYSKARVDT